jgi:hypothetical protein
MSNILRKTNGKPWLTDENKTVPAKCPICGGDVGLFFRGEPIFLCKENNKHYFGTLKFPEEKRE